MAGLDSCLIIGAGAGPWPFIGTNCEVTIKNHSDVGFIELKILSSRDKVDT